VNDVPSNFEFLAAQMADPRANWSLGTFGEIAEFARDADEPLTLSRSDVALAAMTGRGGIRIEPGNGVRLFASESTTRDSWNHRIALCLPERQCAMNQRMALIELGPDREALREQHREATLFDLGLGALHVDVCVRVADADVAAEIRSHAGRSLFDPGNPAMGAILAANPHRVFVSKLGGSRCISRSRVPTAGVRLDRTRTSSRSCSSTSGRMRPRSRSRRAGFRARIFIPPTRQRMHSGVRTHSSLPVTMLFKRCCKISGTPNSTPSNSRCLRQSPREKIHP
jgi:hypothetical protein